MTDSGCETTSPTFLLCEAEHAREAACVCSGQKVPGCGGVGRLCTQTCVGSLKALRAANADPPKIARSLERARERIEGARTRMPAAETAMGGALSGFQGDVAFGPFPMAGP